MSFLLQGNARSLSFHGEANAPSPSSPGALPGALGKPRVRKATTQPPRAMPSTLAQPTTRMGDAPAPAQAIRTPYPFPHRIPTPIPGLHEARSPYGLRPPADETFSDQDPTMALGRDADVMPGARVPARPLPAAGRPIPHFRGPSLSPPLAPSLAPPARADAAERRRPRHGPLADHLAPRSRVDWPARREPRARSRELPLLADGAREGHSARRRLARSLRAR